MDQQGSQLGSQATPSKTYGKDTLRPVTIRQLLHARQPHPDAEFQVDGTDVTQVTLIGQIRNISTQTTNVTYKLDDGTAIIEVKVWNNPDSLDAPDGPQPPARTLVDGDYARVYGRMKSFNNKRNVVAHVIRKVTDFNEIGAHLLEATAVHLYFTRGPPPQKDANQNQAGAAGRGPSGAGQQGSGGAMPGQANPGDLFVGGASAATNRMSVAARSVYDFLRTQPQMNEGLHAQKIATDLKMPYNDVMKAADELQGFGLIFTTVDDETWAVLES